MKVTRCNVSQVWKNVICPLSRTTDGFEPSPRWGNCRGRTTLPTGGRFRRQTDTSVCTPLARSVCSSLVTPCMCPSRRSSECALGKTVRKFSRNAAAHRETRRRSTHRPTPKAPSSEVHETHKTVLADQRWGGMQGRRTAFSDTHPTKKQTHQRRRRAT